MDVRVAEQRELDHLARIWYEGWNDAHAHLVPAGLKRYRTLESFRNRLDGAFLQVRVVGPSGAPVGFAIVKADELYQLYVEAPARGSGAAAALIDDAEARLVASGVATAWLACAVGNYRAARFYEKCGWHLVGTVVYPAEITDGQFDLEVWRYEKSLRVRRS
jgi:GNAT superfamily N-acetyltransferase